MPKNFKEDVEFYEFWKGDNIVTGIVIDGKETVVNKGIRIIEEELNRPSVFWDKDILKVYFKKVNKTKK